MTSSDGSGGQRSDAKQARAIRDAVRLHGRLCLAALVLIVGVIPAIALADEAPSSSPSELPLSALEEAVASPNTDEVQLTDPQAAEELPHQDLGREEAVELTEAVFDPVLQSVSGQFQNFEVEKYLSDNAAVVSVDAQPESLGTVGGGAESTSASIGKETVLLESTVPLRTEDANGEMAPVDLELEASGTQLEPREPLVKVRLPQELGEGIQLPEAGVGIDVEGAPSGRAPSIIDESVAAYPNVGLNTDFSVVPTSTGLETLTTLRSADAPHEQTLHLDLPPGAELRQDHLGAEVVQGDKTILRVQPPFGVDANGESVPVALTVSGDSLSIVASPDEHTAYPALIDPIIEAHDWFAANDTYGQSAWHQKVIGSNMYASSGTGVLKAVSEAGYQSSGSQAGWYYWVPRLQEEEALGRRPTSYIARMTLWHIGLQSWGSQGGPQPYLFAGIWGGEVSNEHWAGSPGHEAVWALAGNGPETWMNPGYEVKFENGEPGKRDKGSKVAWGIGIATYENVLVPATRSGLLGAASVEVADDDNPLPQSGSITPWVNNVASVPLTDTAEDTGLGVKSVTFALPWRAPTAVTNPCAGNALWPCPLTWTASLPANQYYPNEMPQGFDYIPLTTEDVVGNKSTPGAFKALVKVDHTAPALSLSGTLTEQGKVGTSASQYKLQYAATDGDSEAAAPLASFGSAGTGEGKTQRPIGITTDGTGNVWVVDRGNNRLEKFDESGKFLMQFGSTGSGNGQFLNPNGIAISSAGNLWIADAGNHRLQEFNPKGEYLQQFGTGYTPGGPEGGTVLREPYGVATAPGGMLWVSDFTGQRVAEYRESSAGERFVRNAYGSVLNPTGSPEFLKPAGLATDPQGNLWVVDCEHAKIKMFDPNGKFVTQFGAYGGAGDGQFYSPTDIDVAPSGNILVTDNGNNRIEEFQPTGNYLRKFGSLGAGSGQLSDPHGIALGANNTVFVADASNHRVMRWSHADQDPQSGTTKVQIKVDGQLKAIPYSQACATNSCRTSGEWIYNANEYATGPHKVEVVSTDGVNLVTNKPLEITSINDTAAPQLSATSTFFNAPDGWLEQKSYSYNASATDVGGSGIKSLSLKIDGKVVKSVTQSCPNGGCSAALGTNTIDMTAYAGGSHPAELIATDVANRVAVKSWTINVNPIGVVPVGETTDTLEAFENTAEELEPVAPTSEFLEPEIIQAGDNPGFQKVGGVLKSTGTPASTSINIETEAVTVEGTQGAISIAPVGAGSSMDAGVEDGVAAVTPSVAGGVDTVVRPEYNGALFFTDIRQSTSPDHFTWHLSLQPGQSIRPVDDQAAEVIFEDGHEMGLISAMPAHDATGAAVPTHIKIEGSNVTLVVSHKAGSYVYPVVAGQSFEVGYSSVTVIAPEIEEEELKEEGTPLRTPFPPSVGDKLTTGEVSHLVNAPHGHVPVPSPRASASKVREFEVDQTSCHPDTCKAYEVHQYGPLFTRYTESVEWQHGLVIHCDGSIEFPFTLSTSIDIVNTGFTGHWGAKKGSDTHLTTWCHYELDVWADPVNLNIPGVPHKEAARSMQVWVYPNGFQTYHTYSWKGQPTPIEN